MREDIIPRTSRTHLIRKNIWIDHMVDFSIAFLWDKRLVYSKSNVTLNPRVVLCRDGMDLLILFLCWNRFPDGVVLDHSIAVLVHNGWSVFDNASLEP